MVSLLSWLLVYGTYQDTVINYLHGCEMYCYEGQSPTPLFPPNFCHAVLLTQYLVARENSGSEQKYVLCHTSTLPITLSCGAKLWAWSWEPLRTNRAPKNTNIKIDPSFLHTHTRNYVERHSLPTIMQLFSRSSYFVSFLNRLLI